MTQIEEMSKYSISKMVHNDEETTPEMINNSQQQQEQSDNKAEFCTSCNDMQISFLM